MILGRDEVRALYRRTAPFYDWAVWMYRLMGLGGERDRAIAALLLGPGDAVVDIGYEALGGWGDATCGKSSIGSASRAPLTSG